MTEVKEGVQPIKTEEIISRFGGEILRCINEDLDSSEGSIDRLAVINEAKRNIEMIRGNQWLIPRWNGDVAEYISADRPSNGEDKASIKFAYPINVVGSDCWKYVAVVGMRAPNIKMTPQDEEDPQSVNDARSADVCFRDLYRSWKADKRQQEVAYYQWTTGPVYFHTPYTTDGERFGRTKEPKIEVSEVEVAPGISVPMPQVVGSEEYENGDVDLLFYTQLEVSHPSKAKNLSECDWLCLDLYRHKAALIKRWPKLAQYRDRDDLDGSLNSDKTAAAEAITQAESPAAVGKAKKLNHWRHAAYWIRPVMFEMFKDPELREQLKLQYPNGVKIDFVGEMIMELRNERMDEVWSVCKTGRGAYILSKPLVADVIPIQRALNDFFNLAIETVLRAIPKTIVDQMLLDRKAMRDNEALPAEVIFTKMPEGTDIGKKIAQLPMAKFSEQLVPFAELLRKYSREIDGIMEPIFGGGDPTSTWRDAKQRKDQAMMQLAPPYAAMQEAWSVAGENAVRLRAKYGVGQIKAAPRKNAGMFGSSMERTSMQEINPEGWYAEAEEGIPITMTEVVDRLTALLREYPPEVQQILGLLDPVNANEINRLLGLSGFESPLADVREKLQSIIDQLLREQPIEQPDMMTGQVMTLPSMEPDPLTDDIPFNVQMLKKWFNSRRALSEQTSNPAGYANVRAYLETCTNLLPPPMPLPGPEGEGAAPPPASGGGEPPPPPGPVPQQVAA